MFRVRTYNQIAWEGLRVFPKDHYEVGSELADPHGILLRSHKLTLGADNTNLHAIARAGAGYNNIPVEACTEQGIVVFNTPGANANSVKELVIASLLNASRNIINGQAFVNTLANQDVTEMHKAVEAEKKHFKGREIAGKTLGIVGLGSIGSKVADAALTLDMKVLGYDPALSVEAAWQLSSRVERMEDLPSLFSRCDYVTLHVPLADSTHHLIDNESLRQFKPGAVLLNFAREPVVDTIAVVEALNQGRLASYFCDFPNPMLVGHEAVYLTPHLGASTTEAEINCAVMAAEQMRAFLEDGNITNSVNFPVTLMEKSAPWRFAVINKNIPAMLGQILSVLAECQINVVNMLNKSRDDIAYNLIDIETELTDKQLEAIRAIDGIIGVRVFQHQG